MNSNNQSSFRIAYTPSGGATSTLNASATSSSYTLSGLSAATSYSITVAACNSAGCSGAAGPLTASTASACTKPHCK